MITGKIKISQSIILMPAFFMFQNQASLYDWLGSILFSTIHILISMLSRIIYLHITYMSKESI